MSGDPELEGLLDRWLSDGPDRAPDYVIDRGIGIPGRIRQRPAALARWRRVTSSLPVQLAAAAAVIVLVGAGIGLVASRNNYLVGRSAPHPHLYWANQATFYPSNGTTEIGRVNLDGTGVERTFITTTTACGVAVIGDHLYWGNVGGNAIGRANLDGTDVRQDFITGLDAPCGIGSDGTHLFWGNVGLAGTGSTIGRANLDGTGVDNSFITGALSPAFPVVDGQYVYWANSGKGSGTTIGRANLDGTDVRQDFITGADGPMGIGVAQGHIFWTNAGTNIWKTMYPGLDRVVATTIGRANLDGTDVRQDFISGASAPCGVAIDGNSIYWGDFGRDTIARADLDGTATQPYVFVNLPASQPCGVAIGP